MALPSSQLETVSLETVSVEPQQAPTDPLAFSAEDLKALDLSALGLGALTHSAERLELDPEAAQNGLAKLVLTVVELLRQLSERQAVRRMEAGSLTEIEIERVGAALLRLEDKMKELKTQFGLSDEDLNLDLGPLGRLL